MELEPVTLSTAPRFERIRSDLSYVSGRGTCSATEIERAPTSFRCVLIAALLVLWSFLPVFEQLQATRDVLPEATAVRFRWL